MRHEQVELTRDERRRFEDVAAHLRAECRWVDGASDALADVDEGHHARRRPAGAERHRRAERWDAFVASRWWWAPVALVALAWGAVVAGAIALGALVVAVAVGAALAGAAMAVATVGIVTHVRRVRRDRWQW